MSMTGIYDRAPLFVQNLMATGYGLREVRRRHGRGFRRDVDEHVARQWWDPEQLERDQSSRLRRMIAWSAAQIPYYRRVFDELGIDPRDIREAADLAVLPILEKDQVRADPELFLPQSGTRGLIAQATGGTTGVPLRYWVTRDAMRMNYAVYEARCRMWAGVRFGQRMASLQGKSIVPSSQVGGPYWRRNAAFNQMYFSVYHLNNDTMGDYIDELARFDPELVVGYTSAVYRIALGIVERNEVGRVRPTAVIVSSETLTPAMRSVIETAFGCRVTDAYSLGELVAFVSECEQGELHISPEHGVMELVEGDGGTEVIATGLINRGMPLLRYRTGDLAVAGDGTPSLCGRGLPVLAGLTGRVDDVVLTPEGVEVSAGAIALAFQVVPNLRRAQVRQERVEQVVILAEVDESFTQENEDFMVAELQRRLGGTISCTVERVDVIPKTSGGKERLVVSSVPALSAP